MDRNAIVNPRPAFVLVRCTTFEKHMPPFYDIYGFSKKRDPRLIEKFLNNFAFRNLIEEQNGCELAVYENDKYSIEEKWIPVKTLSEVIYYGVSNEVHGFAFYIGPNGLKDDIKSLILKFTYDSAFIYGLSIETKTDTGEDNYKRALELEKALKELLQVELTSIQVEDAPADDWEEFNEGVERWIEMNEEKRKTLYNKS